MKKRIIIVLLLIVISSFLLLFSTVASFSAGAGESFVRDDFVMIGHLTDPHYYPLNYCDKGDSLSFNKEVIGATKLLVENQMMVEQTLENIENASFQNQIIELDYLVVSGDITLDGEIQSHYEISNMLRELQNSIRETNPDFQIFCTPGNHDLHNPDAISRKFYEQLVGKALNINRMDFSYLYSGLGMPDYTIEQLDAYYQANEDRIIFDNLSFTPSAGKYYVISQNASTLQFSYQIELNRDIDEDYLPSELSYYAMDEEERISFLCLDEEVSDEQRGHVAGGKIFQESKDWIINLPQNEDYLKIAVMHHNVLPHFSMQDSILKDFTLYKWRESADFLADNGFRYSFTGHMHAHDVISHVSYEGNPITDTQTGSSSGYEGAFRIAKIERGNVGNKYAENFSSILLKMVEADFSRLFEDGFLLTETESSSLNEPWSYYLDFNDLRQFIEKRGNEYICLDCGDYAVHKLFYSIVESLRFLYINPDFISGAGGMLAEILDSSGAGQFVGSLPVATLVNNIIRHIEEKALSDYVFPNDIEGDFYDIEEGIASSVLGAKISGKVTELIYDIINLKLGDTDISFFNAIMFAYTGHQIGNEPYIEYMGQPYSEYEKAFESLRNGALVKELLNRLLDENDGLLGLIMPILSEPIDLSIGLIESEKEGLEELLSTIYLMTTSKRKDFDIARFDLYEYLRAIVPKLGLLSESIPELITNINFEDNAYDTVRNLIGGYVTDSIYTGLGEIAYSIILSFSSDDYPDGNSTEWTIHSIIPGDEISYISGETEVIPTIENGMLPSMLTVNYGDEPTTSKNFTWFTDRRITGTTIQYVKGSLSSEEFNSSLKLENNGQFQHYATTSPSIDAGIFAMMMDIEVGRHTLSVTGLEPGKMYSYRVGDKTQNLWSPVYTFSTAPLEDDFKFDVLLISDLQGYSQGTYSKARSVIENIDDIFPSGYPFVINCGDSVDNSKNNKHWDFLLNNMGDFWANTTSIYALGNHEEHIYEGPVAKIPSDYLDISSNSQLIWDTEYNYGAWHYNFSQSYSQSKLGMYYSFDYSGVHFTVLNTNDPSVSTIDGEQYNWMIQDLQSTDKKKVIIMHKGPYSAGSHSMDSDVIEIRTKLPSVFFDNDVSIVFQGHDHTYSESYYLDGEGNIVDNENLGKELVDGPGVFYVTLGTLGDKYYKYMKNDEIPLEFGETIHNPTLDNPSFGKLSFDGENLFYKGYSYDLENNKAIEIRKLGGLSLESLFVSLGVSVAFSIGFVLVLLSFKKR